METVKQILIERDGNTKYEAGNLIDEMRQRVNDGENPEDILFEIGLEPDYIFDII